MFARPKKLRPTDGHGVILDLEWFDQDPGDDRDIQPVLIDQILIPAQSVEDVTAEVLDEAIARRLPSVEAEFGDTVEPPQETRAILGKVYDAAMISSRVASRKAGIGEAGQEKGNR